MPTLSFYGAAGEVTGSCYIVSTSAASVMVDMGMHQGEREADEHNRRLPPGDLSKLSAVVLTHAHLDHCGRLPLLVRAGYKGPIFCTAPTQELTAIVLRDAAALQEADAERFNRVLRRPGEAEAVPLYTSQDVERTLPLLRTVQYGVPAPIAQGITIQCFDAGHILGAASVRMVVNEAGGSRTIVFSGDVGVIGAPILRDPVTPPSGDVVLLESTYGDRDHRSLEATRDELLAILQDAQKTQSKVLIPAFAIGRTQDIVFHMGEFLRTGKLRALSVYVDSPMAASISDSYIRHKELFDERARELLAQNMAPLRFAGLTYVRTVDESKRLNFAKGPMVIIAASGMCTGGRILHHLYHNLANPNTQVVIVGYQGEGTLGRRLVDGATSVTIFRDQVPVKAKVHTLGGFSAHAGQSGLLSWAAPFQQSRPRMFLTHGEDGPRAALQGQLKARFNLESAMPAYGGQVQL